MDENEDKIQWIHIIHKEWCPTIDEHLIIFVSSNVIHKWLDNMWHHVQLELRLYIIVTNVIHVWCNVTIHDFLSCPSWLSCPFWLKAHGLIDIYVFWLVNLTRMTSLTIYQIELLIKLNKKWSLWLKWPMGFNQIG